MNFWRKSEGKVVYVRVSDNLANQMFMYAAGYALAKKINAKLKVVFWPSAEAKDYALKIFGINDDVTILTSRALHSLAWRGRRLYGRKFDIFALALRLRYGVSVKTHGHFHFWDGFNKIDDSCYLYGSWQSELYFSQVASDISNIFALSRFSSTETRRLERDISSAKNPVAVHVRFGDYLISYDRDPCPRSYYDRARLVIENLVPNSTFFVFSDDVPRAKELLKGWESTTFVSGYLRQQDMMLMSKCRHNIIANSTFGWWAAWLNKDKSKIVIAPRMWFSKETMRVQNPMDIYPDGWILV